MTCTLRRNINGQQEPFGATVGERHRGTDTGTFENTLSILLHCTEVTAHFSEHTNYFTNNQRQNVL